MLFRVGRNLIAAGCLSLSAAQLAAAADLKYVKSPSPVAVPDTWAGFYLGGQFGYGDDSVRWRNLGTSATFSPLNSLTHDRGSGVIGGGQAGYNFQVNRFVFGVEGSLSAAGFDRSFASPFVPGTDTWSSKLTWLGTATGRIGYGFDSWMPYVKAGLAAGNIDTSITSTTGNAVQGSAVHYGWTAGGGVEFKVAPKFSLGLEYMYTDLGRRNDINGPSTAGTPESYGVGLRSNSFMARFNYLFGR